MIFSSILAPSSRMKHLVIHYPSLCKFHNLTPLVPPTFLNSVLTRGLKYIAPSQTPKVETLNNALDTFFRRVLLKQHYRANPERVDNGIYVPQLYRSDGNWTPQTPRDWKMWTTRVRSEFLYAFETSTLLRSLTTATDSLDSDLILTRHYLQQHPELMIVPTDKNLGPALITQQDYINMCLKHLCDTSTYTQVRNHDEVLNNQRVHEKIQKLNKEGADLFSHIKNIRQFLQSYNENPKIPLFHCLAKVHKKNIAGRPISGAHSWLTTPLSTLLSYALRNCLIISNHDYNFLLRDSKQLISQTENMRTAETDLLVTFDVETLYPRMVHEATVKAVKHAGWPRHFKRLEKWACDATELILNQSFVEFGCKVFKQRKGMAMGTNAAVELANIYVSHFIERTPGFKERKERFMRLWKRFIDDIFMIWKGTRQELDDFILWLNSQNPSLRFTANISEMEADFLDLTAFKHNGRLHFKTFQKSINRFLYIPFNSHHPRHVFRGFVKGELLRYARNCTLPFDFNRQRGLFGIRLENRGYPRSFIQRVFREVQHRDRITLLDETHEESNSNKDSDDDKVFITVPFHPTVVDMQVKEIISRNLKDDMNLNVIVGYRNPPNLNSLLTSSRLNRELKQEEIDAHLDAQYITNRNFDWRLKQERADLKRRRNQLENQPSGILVLHSPPPKRFRHRW